MTDATQQMKRILSTQKRDQEEKPYICVWCGIRVDEKGNGFHSSLCPSYMEGDKGLKVWTIEDYHNATGKERERYRKWQKFQRALDKEVFNKLYLKKMNFIYRTSMTPEERIEYLERRRMYNKKYNKKYRERLKVRRNRSMGQKKRRQFERVEKRQGGT